MKSLLLFFLFSSFGSAKEEVNDKDKKETHKIIIKDTEVGSVTVNSHFTGDGVMETTEIKFTVQCAAGYKLNPKFTKNTILHTYDYGANGKLTTWDSENHIVTIHYRTAKIQDDGRPSFDKSKTLEVPVKDACTK